MSGSSGADRSPFLPKQPRSKATYERILAAAGAIFAERGWDELSTNAVAQAAGVSIGSLYRYFPDKLAIARAIAEREADFFCAAVMAALDTATSDCGPALAHALLESLTSPRAGGSGELGYSRLMGSACSEELGKMASEIEDLIEGRLASRLVEKISGLGESEARLKVKVSRALIKGMAAEIARSPGEEKALRAELERLLGICLTAP
jgi:AcrR family transcriptional regulator